MKSGRGGGAGGSDTRKWVRDGTERHGPVTSEPPLYPPNPNIERAAELDDAAAAAVLAYRLLTNHWRTAECCIPEKSSKLAGRNYSISNETCAFDYEAQKEAIVSYCGSQFFPAELLQTRFVRVQRGASRAAADSKRHRLKEMEKKEDENKGNEDKTQNPQNDGNAEDDLFAAEDDDFGGDDYAHDYYADEEIEDHMDDGDDGGVLGEITFIILFIARVCSCQETSADFYTFNDASATSSFGLGFEAARALQPGSGYWSSAGEHASDEQASFEEVIPFNTPQECRVIVITMRKPTNEFFGINQITPIGAGQPMFMIIAGISSPAGDMCLEVEGGKVNQEGARVLLNFCEDAIAAADGRELWQTNPQAQIVSPLSSPPRCLVLQGGDTTDGGSLVLSNCSRALEEGDGRSGWTFQGNSQLRISLNGVWCLSQRNANGASAGFVDLVGSAGVTAEASSSEDEAHGPQKAIDRNSDTAWESQSFQEKDEFPVTLDLNLGKVVRLTAARIEWAKPALAYTIQVSTDNTTFVDVVQNEANPSFSTKDPLDGVSAQIVRIRMQRPHPRLGLLGESSSSLSSSSSYSSSSAPLESQLNENKYRYAIREVHLFANKLEPAVAECKDAANSDDARDKYFIYYVSNFDGSFAEKAASVGVDVIAKRNSLQQLAAKVEELFGDMENCQQEKNQQQQRMQFLRHSAGQLLASFHAATQKVKAVAAAQTIPVGLEAFVPKGLSQLKGAVRALKLMGVDMEGEEGIPIAYDRGCSFGACTSTFYDLFDGSMDLTSLVLSFAAADSAAAASLDTAGFGRASGNKMSYFALASTPLAAILCSTASTGEAEQSPALPLGCEDVMEGHAAFKCSLNECPEGPAEGSSTSSPSLLHSPPLSSFVELSPPLSFGPSLSPPPYDPALAAATEAAKDRIMATHGIDPVAIKEAKEEAGVTVGEARKRVKPTEQINDSLFAEAVQLFREVETLTSQVLAASGAAAARLQYLQQELQQLEETHALQRGFEDYTLLPQETEFAKEFTVEDCPYTRGGPSHWGFAALVAQHRNVFGQSMPIKGIGELQGTFAFLRRRKFYDFVLRVQFLPMGSGDVGIGFRMQDRDNGFMLLLQQHSGSKKLIRIEKGEKEIIAKRQDGGFVQGVWQNVKIQTMMGHIKICVGEETEEEAEVLT
ncbi:LCCL domain-containing protein / F5/8 type C domain-containing protein, putative [Eimeria brunetti]|uniref:LCCL domain-containing protein / F5/8 type C domain-containing protein, putative n=1 Tax=Eimeria brunetti TaxID=51314 RepID=U6LRI8_9EIME|nr:LCCL domain-containing protein / F5/8 type C domain-containing protein, putative [Eimeria brunetti]